MASQAKDGDNGGGAKSGGGGGAEIAMELEHVVGFSPISFGLAHHLFESEKYIHACGASVVISHFSDSHNQTFLLGHDAFVSCLAVSASGKRMATGQGGKNSDICLWEHGEAGFVLKHRYYMHDEEKKVVALSFSHDEKLLFSVGEDGQLFVWDTESGNYVTYDKCPIYSRATSLQSGGIWTDVKGLPTDNYQVALALNDRDSKIGLYCIKINPFKGQVERLPIKAVSARREYTSLAWSPDRNLIFAGTDSGEVALSSKSPKEQSFSTGKFVSVCRLGVKALQCITVGGSFRLVVGGGDGSVTVLKPFSAPRQGMDFEAVSRFDVKGAVIALSANVFNTEAGPGCELLAGTQKGFLYRINASGPIFEDASRKVLPPLRLSESHVGAVKAVAFGAKVNEYFATCGSDSTVRVWDASDYTVRMQASVNIGGVVPSCVALTLDSEIALSGWSDGKVRAYLVSPEDQASAGGMLAWQIDNVASGRGLSQIVLSNNERFFVTGDHSGMVRVWGYSGHELFSQLKQHMDEITGFSLFDDDVHLLSCSRDKSFYCWDLRREKAISWHTQRQGAVLDIALSHDQTQVLTVGTDAGITFWDLRQPNPIKVIEQAHASDVKSIAVSRNGLCFATGGKDHKVKLWDIGTGKLMAEGNGHSGPVNSLCFSPDCKQIVSVADDGELRCGSV